MDYLKFNLVGQNVLPQKKVAKTSRPKHPRPNCPWPKRPLAKLSYNQHMHDETLILPYTSTYMLHASQYKPKTQHPSPITQTYNILQLSKANKNTMFNNDRYTTNIRKDPHTVTTTDKNTTMHHIHTSIVFMHLATIDNNKILRTPPPHIL